MHSSTSDRFSVCIPDIAQSDVDNEAQVAGDQVRVERGGGRLPIPTCSGGRADLASFGIFGGSTVVIGEQAARDPVSFRRHDGIKAQNSALLGSQGAVSHLSRHKGGTAALLNTLDGLELSRQHTWATRTAQVDMLESTDEIRLCVLTLMAQRTT